MLHTSKFKQLARQYSSVTPTFSVTGQAQTIGNIHIFQILSLLQKSCFTYTVKEIFLFVSPGLSLGQGAPHRGILLSQQDLDANGFINLENFSHHVYPCCI